MRQQRASLAVHLALYFLFFDPPLANSACRSTVVFPAFYAGVLSLSLSLSSLRGWCHVKAGLSKSDLQPCSLDFFISLGVAAVADVVTSKEFEKLSWLNLAKYLLLHLTRMPFNLPTKEDAMLQATDIRRHPAPVICSPSLSLRHQAWRPLLDARELGHSAHGHQGRREWL